MAKEVDGFGACELFADEAGDEAAATDFSSGFHAAVDLQQLAPRGGEGFAREQVAEDDAPAVEQEGREEFNIRLRSAAVEQSPAAGGVAWARRFGLCFRLVGAWDR